MTRIPLRSIAALAASMAALTANASLAYDANVTNNVIYGSGNSNGGFTVDTQNNIELGLRAHVRYPTPLNQFNSNGDGTYSFATGGGTPSTRANWNFDWSINSDASGTSGVNLDALSFVLGIDYDPSASANFDTFSPTSTFTDNSFGNNASAEGAGLEAPDAATYASYLSSYNLVQNSWNLDFFNETFTRVFDPTVDGTYSFYLAAFDQAGNQLARTDISVIVGNGGAAVPEPASLALVGLALAGAAFAGRKRRL